MMGGMEGRETHGRPYVKGAIQRNMPMTTAVNPKTTPQAAGVIFALTAGLNLVLGPDAETGKLTVSIKMKFKTEPATSAEAR